MLLLWTKLGVSVRETGELERSDGGEGFPVLANPYPPAVANPSTFEPESPLASAVDWECTVLLESLR